MTTHPRPLFIAGFLISSVYYIITSILPIYCIESCAQGGLEWSKAEAFSLYGTYVAVACISPFLGGLCADFFCGRRIVASFGYILALCGILLLPSCRDSYSILVSTLSIALGTGFVKVCLMSSLGTITLTMDQNIRQKLYEYYYVGMCMGFVVGNFVANPLFDLFKIKGIVGTVIGGVIISALLGFQYFTPFMKKEETNTTIHPLPRGLLFLVLGGLIFLAIPFFLVSHQCHTSISLFIHQAVDRSIAGFTIPTLWFASLGSLIMVFFVPLHRRLWRSRETSLDFCEFVKTGVGFLLSASGFVCLSLLAAHQANLATSIFALLFANALFLIADIHVRPVLFSSVTRYVPSKYHTFSTAIVYTSVGLGAKLAGTFAARVDSIGFTNTFSICTLICLTCAALSALLWQQSARAQVRALS